MDSDPAPIEEPAGRANEQRCKTAVRASGTPLFCAEFPIHVSPGRSARHVKQVPFGVGDDFEVFAPFGFAKTELANAMSDPARREEAEMIYITLV
jgi:hypothetical protein